MYFRVSGNAPMKYPVETFFGVVYCSNNEIIEIPQQYPFKGNWGIPQTNLLETPKEYHGPFKLDLVYLSIIEQKFYSIEATIPQEMVANSYAVIKRDTVKDSIPYIVIGMAPYGLISVWFANSYKTTLISSFWGEEIQVTMNMFRANRKDATLNDICADYIDINNRTKKKRLLNIIPKKDLFAKYMQQFTYRYLPLFEKYNDAEDVKWQKYKEEDYPEYEYIEESLFDGTFDKLHDDGLLKYHQAGKPKKISIKWHIKKSEYAAYFWFEDEKICSIFERFYGTHPDTKTDFIIRIDAEKKKYELALFRHGLKEPQIISEDAYQLLVFKNKFEDYRSDNYNQERGAWIW